MNKSEMTQGMNCSGLNTVLAEDICSPLPLLDWFLIVLEILIALITILGNFLVIFSVCLVKNLRKPHNYLLVSLAAADLLVGIFVMPLSILIQIMRYRWPLGSVMCDLWITVDVTCCSASIFNLTAIALDRYVAITAPFFYKVHATLKTMLVVIFMAWLLPFLVLLPNLLNYGNEHFLHLENLPGFEVCRSNSDSTGHILVTVAGCFTPLLILLFAYSNLIHVLLKQKRKDPNWKHRLHIDATTALQAKSGENKMTVDEDKLSNSETNEMPQTGSVTMLERVQAVLRDNKGCAMLGSVMIVYLVCWLPFFITIFLEAVTSVLGTYSVLPTGWTFQRLVWLGYVNSALNPFIYSMFIPEFRQSFKQILLCRCNGMAARLRMANYKNQIRQTSSQTQSSI